MDDFPIVGRYKLYKKGIERLVRWLTDTAQRCGGSFNFFETLHSRAAQSSVIVLTTKDIISLANLIANDESANIPEDMLEITKDVIAGRELCALWYKIQGKRKNEEAVLSDRRHAFFIDTLKHVHDILSSAKKVRNLPLPSANGHKENERRKGTKASGKGGQAAAGKQEQRNLDNIFMHLQVEEPPENPFGNTTSTFEEPATIDEPEPHSRKRNDNDFVAFCLFQELSDVRQYICNVWKQYASGKRSLFAAGVVTEVAFGLMRHVCVDYANVIGDELNYRQLLETWNLGNMFDDSMSEEEFETVDDFGLAPQTDKMFCREAAAVLQVLGAEFDKFVYAQKNEAPPEDIYEASEEYATRGIGARLVNIVPQLFHLGCLREGQPLGGSAPLRARLLDDELSYYLVSWAFSSKRSDSLSLWLVSANQASIDIHSVLNGRTSDGLKALEETITATNKSMETCLTLLCGRSVDVKGLWLTPHEWFSRPFVPKPIGRILEPDVSADGGSLSAVAELIPSITAMISLHLRCNALSFGIAVTNARASILALVHLYKAAQHYGLVPLPWADLDFILAHFIATQPSSKSVQPIVTQVNPNADAYAMARHFRMALGLPAAQRERSARPKLQNFESKGSDCR